MTDLVAFLGPSLPAREARRIARCTVLPPAAQGDVWRALALRPRAIALVDGVFESVPSVWHHELLDALDAGVAVFGGASMGALRAVELAPHGMVGVGRVFRWYRDGVLSDDADVALLHAGPELGFRPLTVPLVAVRRAAELALAERALSPAEARALLAAAQRLHYASRTWRTVFAAAPRLGAGARRRLEALLARGDADPKAEDARATIAAAAAFAASAAAPAPPGAPRRPSSLVRRAKLAAATSIAGSAAVRGADVLAALAADRCAVAIADAGLRRAVVAALGRALGLEVGAEDVRGAREAWRRELGLSRSAFERFLGASGLDAADAARLCEDLALERRVLASAARALPDGPSQEEGLALGARLSGAWAEAARRLALARRRRFDAARGAGYARPMAKRGRAGDGEAPGPFHNPFGGLAERLGMQPAPPAPRAEAPAAKPAPARAVVRLERKGRGGKEATVIEKLALSSSEAERWLGELKAALGCGGAVEGDALVLQGDQRARAKALLEARGVRRVTVG
jgi:translation initiation factor 1 (eIF-1/SUI1)